MNGSSPLDLREILWKVRHLLWVALLPIVTAACAGLLYLVITRQYEAAATVSVGEQTSVSPALEPLVGDQRGPAESSTPTVIQIDNRLHSRSLLTSIVNQLGLAHTREIRLRAAEEAQHGVRVNAVCPGSTLTPFTLARAKSRGMTEEELRVKGFAPSLLNRWATPEEIAYPVLWLASDEASFITGAVLMADGGLSAI